MQFDTNGDGELDMVEFFVAVRQHEQQMRGRGLPRMTRLTDKDVVELFRRVVSPQQLFLWNLCGISLESLWKEGNAFRCVFTVPTARFSLPFVR